MKWGSTSYVYAFPIFFRAPVFSDRIGVGVITARAGDGELRQEWIEGRAIIDRAQSAARSLPKKKMRP